MARYSGTVLGLTPSLTDDNWALDAAAAEMGSILEVHWGGEVTTSTLMRTRVARSSGQAGAATLGNVAKINSRSAANLLDFALTYATTQPALDAGDLFAESWNAHGGVVRWLAAPGEEFIIIGAAVVSCRNAVGTALSSYGVIWDEV